MKKKNVLWLLMPAVLLSGLYVGGADAVKASEETSETETEEASDTDTAVVIDPDEMFTDRDSRTDYDEADCIQILLEGDTASCDSDSVEITGSVVTILTEGTYLLSGTLDDGMILVETDKAEKVQLVLDGVSITCSTSAPIYVRQSDKVFITLAPDSENTLVNGGSFVDIDDNNIDAVIFSKDDLTLNGAGSLSIESPAGHGIVSKNDLVITGGTYEITASGHTLSGKDSIRIADGSFSLTAGKDGLHAEDKDDASAGFLYIAGGSFAITSEGDGISAENTLQIDDGDFSITSGGGSVSGASDQTSDFNRGGWFQETSDDSSEEDTVSQKGIKASQSLLLNGGTYHIDSADDAFHSNSSLAVSAGDFEVATGDDGFHADEGLSVTGGTILITESYEGLEGLSITITGGNISLTSSDDGLNAAGGNDQSGFEGWRMMDSFGAGSDSFIEISGGTLYVNASGDGIDSNGSLRVSGGELYVAGPISGADGALDYESDAAITGGSVIAVGSSGMALNFGSSSTQGSILVSVGSQTGDSPIVLTDSDGQALLSWQPDKAYDSVVLSCPEIVEGGTYTLTAGSSTTEITMESLIYGSGGMGGMGGHGGMGGRGGRNSQQNMPGDAEDMGNAGEMGGNPMDGDNGQKGGFGNFSEDMTPPDMDGQAPGDMTPPDMDGQAPGDMTPPDADGQAPGDMTPPDADGQDPEDTATPGSDRQAQEDVGSTEEAEEASDGAASLDTDSLISKNTSL